MPLNTKKLSYLFVLATKRKYFLFWFPVEFVKFAF